VRAVRVRSIALATVVVAMFTVQVFAQDSAADAKFEKSLLMLDPGERLEQVCDYAAMAQIRSDEKNYLPDRAVANASGEAIVIRDTLDTKGGAFRSRGKWYALTFTCQAAPDHMSVISFKYTIGPEIPETKWAAFGLWD
jgi:Domain of Unknown Function (DUF930)